jgi:hypothetical protein
MQSNPIPASSRLWCQWLRTTLQMCEIPRATRVCLSMCAIHPVNGSEIPLGWVNFTLIDYKNQLRTGVMSLNLWPGEKANPIGTCVPNYKSKNPTRLIIELYRFPLPVQYVPPELVDRHGVYEDIPRPRRPDIQTMSKVIAKDPLYVPNQEEKKLLWQYRYYWRNNSRALAKVLTSVTWTKSEDVQEAHRMLTYWAPLSPVEALELLDAYFADEAVRQYAVQRLHQFSAEELMTYLPQLTQVLKYEPYHDSALARFLLDAALRHRPSIGHAFFWHLHAELHVPEIAERYSLLLEIYLRGCGDHREELIKQMEVSEKLRNVAKLMKEIPYQKRKPILHKALEDACFPEYFALPMNPSLEAKSIIYSQCKSLDSITAPLFLLCENADPMAQPFEVIFKAGDDLRQDILTLQMFGIMDRLWKKHGLDLHMTIYGCIATGEDIGFIEVVPASVTTAQIHKKAGGASAVLKSSVISNWLKSHNPTESEYAAAVENFINSCAGYCVATYVLGIGDRHNDNIMLTKSGLLFHIDFAHFLGNMMEWKGFKRETAPFVLTPQFLHVMGGDKGNNFKRFISLCCTAYNVIRRYGHTIITLFQMMLSTGIRELKGREDLLYLREVLALEMTDEEAAEFFTEKIYESLRTKRTQLNDAIHLLAHKNAKEK